MGMKMFGTSGSRALAFLPRGAGPCDTGAQVLVAGPLCGGALADVVDV
jgi:hypothetical protein